MSTNYSFPFDDENFRKSMEALIASQIETMKAIAASHAEAHMKILSSPEYMKMMQNLTPPVFPNISSVPYLPSHSKEISEIIAKNFQEALLAMPPLDFSNVIIPSIPIENLIIDFDSSSINKSIAQGFIDALSEDDDDKGDDEGDLNND